jgi:hypothetical protein
VTPALTAWDAKAADEAPSITSLAVVGTEFHVTLSDGSLLRSIDLIGAVLNVAGGLRLRLDAVEPDPQNGRGRVVLHSFSVEQADGSWLNPCSPGPDGRQLGFPLAGRALPDGQLVAQADSFEIVCSSGAQGKCVRFGYHPWEQDPDGPPMLDLYNACIRLVRADYCGDGSPTTRDGTVIDLYDRFGIQKDEPSDGMSFEAAWGPEGAVCLARTRIAETASVEEVVSRCPRLQQVPIGSACTEAAAKKLPRTLLFNKSFPRAQ